EKDSLKDMMDLNRRELVIMAPLVVLTIFFGFYPAPILNMTATAVNAVVARTDTVAQAVKTAALLLSF
ncbi:MAG: hypothetical protein B7X92_16135, partial [Novosphingobium sp. 17-62-9]